jgi:hypothetical protein
MIAEKKTVALAEADEALRCSLASLTNRHGAEYAWQHRGHGSPTLNPTSSKAAGPLALVVP